MGNPSSGEWRTDPDDRSLLRWWDGEGWTDHTHENREPQSPSQSEARAEIVATGRSLRLSSRARTGAMVTTIWATFSTLFVLSWDFPYISWHPFYGALSAASVLPFIPDFWTSPLVLNPWLLFTATLAVGAMAAVVRDDVRLQRIVAVGALVHTAMMSLAMVWVGTRAGPSPEGYESAAAVAFCAYLLWPAGASAGVPTPCLDDWGSLREAETDAQPAASPHGEEFEIGERVYGFGDLRSMAAERVLRPSSKVRIAGDKRIVEASAIPGVFSERKMTTTLLLSVIFGGLGVDRFYLGQVGLGLLKLFTGAGGGVWYFVDVVRIGARSIRDAKGLPLR